MTKRARIAAFAGGVAVLVMIVGAIVVRVFLVVGAYEAADADYQRAMDPIRIKHGKEIIALVLNYADRTGHFPLAERATDKSFMVVIGHSQKEEDSFAADPVIARGGRFSNASDLEAELSKEFGEAIRLPRDPQKVATYAPNVYVYFLAEDQMTVAVHLFKPTPDTIPYDWRGGKFHAWSETYLAKKKAELAP